MPILSSPVEFSLADGGNTNLAVDGSGTPVDFTYTCPAGKTLEVVGFEALVTFAGKPSDTTFAGVALTNGIIISVVDEVSAPVKTFGAAKLTDWDLYQSADRGSIDGTGLSGYKLFWDVEQQEGARPTLQPGYSVGWRIRDDLSSADLIQVKVCGHLIDL